MKPGSEGEKRIRSRTCRRLFMSLGSPIGYLGELVIFNMSVNRGGNTWDFPGNRTHKQTLWEKWVNLREPVEQPCTSTDVAWKLLLQEVFTVGFRVKCSILCRFLHRSGMDIYGSHVLTNWSNQKEPVMDCEVFKFTDEESRENTWVDCGEPPVNLNLAGGFNLFQSVLFFLFYTLDIFGWSHQPSNHGQVDCSLGRMKGMVRLRNWMPLAHWPLSTNNVEHG